MGPWWSARTCSRVFVAATAFRPVAGGVGGAELAAPVSQGACRRVCGAATPKAPLNGAAPRQVPSCFLLLPLAEIPGAGGAAWDPGGAEEHAAGPSGLRRRKDLSTPG